jgi:hypothetical protein
MKNLVTVLAFLLITTVSAFAQTVYSSNKGEKYHTADCRLSGNAEGMTVANAKKAGKKACEMCKPDQLGKAKLNQCEGKTKEGVRCKRMTGNKNKKCYQHSTK